MNADGSNPRQLTFSDGIDDNQPTFSPDGRTIAWSGRVAAMSDTPPRRSTR
jgi:Tol biopolymer transport system component